MILSQQSQSQSPNFVQGSNLDGGLDPSQPRDPERPESHLYEYLLDSCEKLFEGEMDQVSFEENMRYLFGPKVFSYILYSILND